MAKCLEQPREAVTTVVYTARQTHEDCMPRTGDRGLDDDVCVRIYHNRTRRATTEP